MEMQKASFLDPDVRALLLAAPSPPGSRGALLSLTHRGCCWVLSSLQTGEMLGWSCGRLHLQQAHVSNVPLRLAGEQ